MKRSMMQSSTTGALLHRLEWVCQDALRTTRKAYFRVQERRASSVALHRLGRAGQGVLHAKPIVFRVVILSVRSHCRVSFCQWFLLLVAFGFLDELGHLLLRR